MKLMHGMLLILFLGVSSLSAANFVVTDPSPGSFAIAQAGDVATIYVDGNDYAGVIRAAGDLAEDVGRVSSVKADLVRATTDFKGRPILIGTIGKSAIIDRLVKEKKIDVGSIAGQW